LQIIDIRSKENPQFRKLKRILTSKGIREEGLFFVMGEKLVHEILAQKSSPYRLQYAVTFEGHSFPLNEKSVRLSKELFNELDVSGTEFPMLVLKLESFPEMNWNLKPQGLEVVAPLSDPKNLGALARSAVGFGAQKLILTKESCHPFLPASIRASAGATLHIPIFQSPLSVSHTPILGTTPGENWALDMHGQDIRKLKLLKDSRLIIGEEGLGLPDELIKNRNVLKASIPTKGIESLNATVSASIAMWVWSQG